MSESEKTELELRRRIGILENVILDCIDLSDGKEKIFGMGLVIKLKQSVRWKLNSKEESFLKKDS